MMWMRYFTSGRGRPAHSAGDGLARGYILAQDGTVKIMDMAKNLILPKYPRNRLRSLARPEKMYEELTEDTAGQRPEHPDILVLKLDDYDLDGLTRASKSWRS